MKSNQWSYVVVALLLLLLLIFSFGIGGGEAPLHFSIKNTGQKPVWVRTMPPQMRSGWSFNLKSWPPLRAVNYVGDAWVLSSGSGGSNSVAPNARIEVCCEIPTNHPFYPKASQLFSTSSLLVRDQMSNLQFRTVWDHKARLLIAEINGDNPTNPVFTVIRTEK